MYVNIRIIIYSLNKTSERELIGCVLFYFYFF